MRTYVTVGEEFTIPTTLARSQAQADLTRMSDGSLLAVWVDADFNTTANRSVRGQFYNPDGSPRGGEIVLTTASGVTPDVVGLSGGGFALSWLGMSGVRVQTFDAAGVATSPPVTVTPTSASDIGQQQIAASPGGGFAVVWSDARTSGADASGTGVRLRLFDASGAAVGGEVLVNSATSGNQAEASVTALDDGRYLVTWTDRGPRGSGAIALIKGQMFDGAGGPIGGEFAVSGASGYGSLGSSVVVLADGRFAISWFSSEATGSLHRVQVFSAEGVKVGSEISTPAHLYMTSSVGPALTALADGGFVISWRANGGTTSDGSGSGVFLQAYDVQGEAVGGVMQVNSRADGEQLDPSVVALDDGGFKVSWTDLGGAEADDDEVRAQIFRPDGSDPSPTVTITSGGGDPLLLTVDENVEAAAQVTALAAHTDEQVRFAITGGADAAMFAIDFATGGLRFVVAPDFEAPSDLDGNNVYDVIVSAEAGAASDTQRVAVTVRNANEGFAGWTDGSRTISEGEPSAGAFTTTDLDGDRVAYSITGGADAALFTIDAITGELRFNAVPDYERPSSAAGSNEYQVAITVSDGVIAEERRFTVSVRDVNEAPVITSDGGGSVAKLSLKENGRTATTLTAADPEGNAVRYSIVGGADAALFAIDADTGRLSFLLAPDYENPQDAERDGLYQVEVAASDSSSEDRQSLWIAVTDVNEGVVFTSFSGAASARTAIAENSMGAATVTAKDADGGPVRYFIAGGADAARFTVDQTGVVRFTAAPDHEAPTDADRNNSYDVIIGADDGFFTANQRLSIDVINVREGRVVYGTSAADTVTPGSTSPSLRATELEDDIYGRDGNDVIIAGAGDDRIDAGAGNDTVAGGFGADLIVGGSGADSFNYSSVNDSRVGAADAIYDFSRSSGDRLNLSAIDANPYASGDQAFAFIGGGAFSGAPGQLRVAFDGANTLVTADLNGDRIADFQITLYGGPALVSSDFVL